MSWRKELAEQAGATALLALGALTAAALAVPCLLLRLEHGGHR